MMEHGDEKVWESKAKKSIFTYYCKKVISVFCSLNKNDVVGIRLILHQKSLEVVFLFPEEALGIMKNENVCKG